MSVIGIVEVLVAMSARVGERALELAQHRALDLEVLEDRLDDEVGAREAGVVAGAGEERRVPLVLVLA